MLAAGASSDVVLLLDDELELAEATAGSAVVSLPFEDVAPPLAAGRFLTDDEELAFATACFFRGMMTR
jgi:hypothetical protein